VSGLDALRRFEVVSAGDLYGAKPVPVVVPAVPHPAPEVPARDAMSDEVPATAQRLAAAATAARWEWRVTYARGTPLLGGDLVDSIVVRLRSRHRMAVGVWVDGKFKSGWHWSAAHSAEGAAGYEQVGYRALVKHVKETPGEMRGQLVLDV
jgi:hypothetical protein